MKRNNFEIELIKLIDEQNTTQYTANEIAAALSNAGYWFDSSSECFNWYKNKLISSFGGLTAAEVVEQEGVDALNDYIISKNEGAFE